MAYSSRKSGASVQPQEHVQILQTYPSIHPSLHTFINLSSKKPVESICPSAHHPLICARIRPSIYPPTHMSNIQPYASRQQLWLSRFSLLCSCFPSWNKNRETYGTPGSQGNLQASVSVTHAGVGLLSEVPQLLPNYPPRVENSGKSISSPRLTWAEGFLWSVVGYSNNMSPRCSHTAPLNR